VLEAVEREMARDLEDRSVIVTGASGGIGSACARLFAAQGAKLTLVDRDEAKLSALAAEINAEALTLTLDISSEEDMERMASRTVERFGGIDALIAAAGILRTGGEPRTVIETSYEEWRKVIEVNLTGTFLSNRAVLAAMLKRGSGDIVNISSTTGRQGRAFDAPYAASKFGVIGLSESLAEEVGRRGIRVQTLLPDAVRTSIWDQSGTTAIKPPHMLSPDRVAEFVLYLITLPRDAFLLNPMLYPLNVRTKRATQPK
jgi:NAD(P)-dependent dehydrogenase (short-subunit alcohol dehydrogenase family)